MELCPCKLIILVLTNPLLFRGSVLYFKINLVNTYLHTNNFGMIKNGMLEL